ncbi:MAG: carboxyl transferase domain-containing protein, partial [Dehalococcoidales bacterium]
MTGKDKRDRLAGLRELAEAGGGKQRIKQQRERGKLTARERLGLLLDPGSFNELGAFVTHRATEFGLAEQKYLGDAVVTGGGKINGRPVFVYSQDFTVLGGSISEVVGQKVCQ